MTAVALDPISAAQWDRRKARHLLNRAGFGVPHALVDRLAAMPPVDAVDYLIEFERIQDSSRPPDCLIKPMPPADEEKLRKSLSAEQLRNASEEARNIERENIGLLQAWWLDRMLTTQRPLQEKLALFWHGHFATSAQKVQSSWFNGRLLQVLREQAAVNVKTLTLGVARSPAMLYYLDNVQNIADGPNENWARELLELFTLGHGHYTERDIQEAARAFTGWSIEADKYVFRPERHDWTEKEFLGRRGNFDGRDIIDIIFQQAAAPEFFARKLWTYFAYAEPDMELVVGSARTLLAHDYELKPMLRELFLSNAFYSDAAIGTQIKSPVQLVVQLCHDLNFEVPPIHAMLEAAAYMGQNILHPPDVGGWNSDRAWINANTLILRYNAPVALVAANWSDKDPFEMKVGNMMGANTGEIDPVIDPEGTHQRLLDAVPRSKRAALVTALGIDSPQYRRWLRAYMARWTTRRRWFPEHVLNQLAFTTAGECVDQLQARFLSTPLRPEQRALLLHALAADEATPLTVQTLPDQRMNETLHLLFSLAEYQLC